MKRYRLDPTILVIMMLSLGLFSAFLKNTLANIVLCGLCLLYLAFAKVELKRFLLVLLVSLPLAFGTWSSFFFFSQQNHLANATLYTSRFFVYLLLGCCLLFSYQLEEILFSLVLQLKLSQTFAYGFLAASELMSDLRKQLKVIFFTGKNKGLHYNFWSPKLYLKLVVTSLDQSKKLAEAMTMAGFSEGQPRTFLYQKKAPFWQWCFCFVFLACYLIFAYLT